MTDHRADRILDLTLGTLLLILALPAMAFSAVLVLITSGRPVLFRQQRIGTGGVPFEILKLRSMIRGAEKIEWPPRKQDGVSLEERLRRDDPRITSAGRVLRRLALDELPQLLNVLRGDMSLVGPRPMPVAEWARLRAQSGVSALIGVRPGMTGPYQIAVRQGCSFEDARCREFVYLQHHSVSDYVRLLVATPLSLARGGGDLLRLPPEHTTKSRLRPTAAQNYDGQPSPEIAALRDVHCLEVLGRTLLFDPVVVRAFAIDETAAGMLGRLQERGSLSLPPDLVGPDREAWEELFTVDQWLAHARASTRPASDAEKPSECRLMLDITRACTLRCAYCYQADQSRSTGVPRHMSWEVAIAAVELLARLAKEWNCPGFLNSTGGEALLRFDFLKQLGEHTAAVGSREHVELRCSFGITNGTMAPPGLAEYLQETDHVISVSLDGPALLHDINRCFPDGRGSHANAVTLARHLLGAGVARSAGATVAANNPYPKDILKYLVDLGFERVVIKPARLPRDHPLAFTDSNLQPLLDSYSELAAFLADSAREGQLTYLLATLNPLDFLGRFLIRTLQGTRALYRCPAARSSFGVSTDGSLYPCSSFCDIPKFEVGSVLDGVDWPKCCGFLAPPVHEKPGCAECWARHLCGGGCAYAAYAVNGSVLEPDRAKCQLIQHLCALSLWLWAELADKCPGAMATARRHLSHKVGRPGLGQSQFQAVGRSSHGNHDRS